MVEIILRHSGPILSGTYPTGMHTCDVCFCAFVKIIIIIIIYFTQRSVTVFMHNDCDTSCSLLN